jgi:hypothetical protein
MRSLTTRRIVRAVLRERGEVVVLAEQEHEHVVRGRDAARGCRPTPRAQLDARVLRDDEIDVLRIVILSGDEQHLLHASGHHELAVDDRAEIAGVEEAVARPRRGRQWGVVVVSGLTFAPRMRMRPVTPSATAAPISSAM